MTKPINSEKKETESIKKETNKGREKMRKVMREIAVIGLLVIMGAAMILPVEAASYYNYDRTKAVDYAKANWNKGVPGSWYFGGIFQADCTNFVSNVINVGGIPMLYFESNLGWYLKDNRWPLKPAYNANWAAAKNFGIWLTSRGLAKQVVMYNKPWSS